MMFSLSPPLCMREIITAIRTPILLLLDLNISPVPPHYHSLIFIYPAHFDKDKKGGLLLGAPLGANLRKSDSRGEWLGAVTSLPVQQQQLKKDTVRLWPLGKPGPWVTSSGPLFSSVMMSLKEQSYHK